MATKRKRSRKPQVQEIIGTKSRSVSSQLQHELGGMILRWGALAGAIAIIVATVAATANYVLPAAFRFYSSDSAPWEGKDEHLTDVMQKLVPVTKAISDASQAAMKAAEAAQQSSILAQVAALKEDQRDLCGLSDRLAAILARLRETPADQFFLDAKADRLREIDALRKRIQANGQVPEC